MVRCSHERQRVEFEAAGVRPLAGARGYADDARAYFARATVSSVVFAISAADSSAGSALTSVRAAPFAAASLFGFLPAIALAAAAGSIV